MAKIIDGRTIAEKIKNELKTKAKKTKAGLAIILVGNDPASEIYVANKIKACNEIGIRHELYKYDNSTDDEICGLIAKLNKDSGINGILVQLPLPKNLDERKILYTISPEKDVDGFLPNSRFVPCTALGIMELINSTGARLTGLHAVVIGRSNIVGKPVAKLLLDADCTVTMTHSKTRDIAVHTRMADILVVAVGKKGIITADMVKPNAIVIDVGISRHDDRICGDVDFNSVSKIAGHITPVPGGVGPLTIAMLLNNLLS